MLNNVYKIIITVLITLVISLSASTAILFNKYDSSNKSVISMQEKLTKLSSSNEKLKTEMDKLKLYSDNSLKTIEGLNIKLSEVSGHDCKALSSIAAMQNNKSFNNNEGVSSERDIKNTIADINSNIPVELSNILYDHYNNLRKGSNNTEGSK